MFYNLLNYENNQESRNRTTYLKDIVAEVKPDLFLVCELTKQGAEDASNYLYDNALVPMNSAFKKADFFSGSSSVLQMAYYNSDKLILENSRPIQTSLRDINKHRFKLNTVDADTNPIYLEVFVTHLKASRGEDNRQRRLSGIQDFLFELENLDPNSYVIFAGDFNFYTSNEEGFQRLIADDYKIQIIDPINRLCPAFPNDGRDYYDVDYDRTYFYNNSSFADVHSQSTRSSSLADGSGGGMDDRFDYIFMSENFTTSTDFYYVNDSYKTIGNNGNCYNSSVLDNDCTGEYSQTLRNNLYFFSDHLPIVMDLKTPSNTLSTRSLENPLVFSGGNAIQQNLEITLQQNANNIVIYNQLGQKMLHLKNVEASTKEIDVQYFSKGVYFIKVDNFTPKKFLKL